MSQGPTDTPRKHNHYYKDVSNIESIDIYSVCKLFGVQDPSGAIHHAIKKLLMPGKRGHKDHLKDVTEARDSLERYLALNKEL